MKEAKNDLQKKKTRIKRGQTERSVCELFQSKIPSHSAGTNNEKGEANIASHQHEEVNANIYRPYS